MRDSVSGWIWARRLRVGGAVIGALILSIAPFFLGGASVRWFTDVEARIAFGALAVFANGLLGAIGGWAVGALIDYFWHPGR